MKSKNLEVKAARNGLGVFAMEKIQSGKTIYKVEGKRYHYTTLLQIRGTFLDNCYRISENYYLSPEDKIGAFFNHSCEPNTRVEKRGSILYIVALQDIEPGEEITFDYSSITARDDVWTMKCNCGNKMCRKIIGSYKKLPKELIKKYTGTKVLPGYILKI